MSDLKLIEFSNTKRFKPSAYKCPQCQGEALTDEWPPNYCGGQGIGDDTKDGCNIKHVCLTCRISFVVSTFNYRGKYISEVPDILPVVDHRGIPTVSGFNVFDIKPLVERDGHLLTPRDVWRYKYHDEYGEWPTESWG